MTNRVNRLKILLSARLARSFVWALTLTSATVFASLLLLTLFTNHTVNYAEVPLVLQGGFFVDLLASNFIKALGILVHEQPLFFFSHNSPVDGQPVWVLPYYPIPLIGLMAACLFVAHEWKRMPERRALAIAGMGLIMLSTSYLWLAGCCSIGPQWIVETWMIDKVYSPLTDTDKWLTRYAAIRPLFIWMQLLSFLSGCALLMRASRRKIWLPGIRDQIHQP